MYYSVYYINIGILSRTILCNMLLYEMAIIDTCENYRYFSHVPIRDFSVAENLIKHCGLYNKNAQLFLLSSRMKSVTFPNFLFEKSDACAFRNVSINR